MSDLWSLLMFIGSALCHQLPERSYFMGDLQMPLCARCIGIHFGFLLSTSWLLIARRRIPWGMPSLRHMALLGAIMLVYIIDVGLSYSGISPSDNLRRTISGLALGVPAPFILLPLLNVFLIKSTNEPDVLLRLTTKLSLPVLYSVGLLAVLLSEDSAVLFILVSVAGLMGVVLFLSSSLSVIVSALLEKSRLGIRGKLALSSGGAVLLILALAALHDLMFS